MTLHWNIRHILLFLWLSTAAATGYAQKPEHTDALARQYAATITAEDLSRHLHIIAADSMQGRDTGSEGQKMAADYIASQFFDSNLKPVVRSEDGVEGYYQEFELVRKTPGIAYIETGTQRRVNGQDFIVQGVQSNIPANTAGVVFTGYGIESDRYSDYAGLDVQGKAVLFFTGEPVARNGNNLVTGTSSPSEWANDTRKKTALAFQKGAQSVFVVYADAKPDQWGQSLNSIPAVFLPQTEIQAGRTKKHSGFYHQPCTCRGNHGSFRKETDQTEEPDRAAEKTRAFTGCLYHVGSRSTGRTRQQ